MRLPSLKLLLAAGAAGAAGVVIVVGIIAAIADNIGLALISVLLVQSAALLAVVDTRRRQGGITAEVSKHRLALKRTDRTIANVSSRVITETRAVENALESQIHDVQADVHERLTRSQKALNRQADFRLQDVEAMFQLFGRFPLRAAMPPSGRWALEPTGLLNLVDLIEHRPIRTIVELGSGTSTLWLSYALEKRGTGGRIISLDHDAHFAEITRAALATHGFAHGPADVRDAPLTPDVLEGHPSPWYDMSLVEDVEDIDLLLIDGPPKSSGAMARYPAFPMLLSRLAPGAILVVDDAARAEETAMVKQWMADVPNLRHLDQAGHGRQIMLILED